MNAVSLGLDMKTYGFDFFGDEGRIQSVDVGAFVSDAEAIRFGQLELSASLNAVAVEIWCDNVRLAHLDRKADPRAPATPLRRRARLGLFAHRRGQDRT